MAGSASQPSHQDLLSGLRDLGYIEGQNVVIEFRSAEGRLELLPELAAELVRLKVAAGRVARLWFLSILWDGRPRLDTTHHRYRGRVA